MGTNKNLDDAFFESMFEDGNLDQPSADFTANVMNLVKKEAVREIEENQPIIGYRYMILIGLAFAGAAFVIFGMDWSSLSLGNLFGDISFKNIKLLSISANLIQSIKGLFASIQIPSILIIVLIAVVSLISLDRMLKKPLTTHLFVF